VALAPAGFCRGGEPPDGQDLVQHLYRQGDQKAGVALSSVRFFLGLIMGETLCNGLWVVIDYFTGKTGNIIFILG